MLTLVTASEMRRCETDIRSREPGITELTLMERASRAAADILKQRAEPGSCILIVADGGNNGGDGLAMQRMLHADGFRVSSILLADETKLSPACTEQLRLAREAGCTVEKAGVLSERIASADWIVDAMFGTGLSRPVCGVFAEAVECINASSAHVLSIDIPSGISADNGAVLGCAVQADVTVTFQFLKRGLVLSPGNDLSGEACIRAIGSGGDGISHTYLIERDDAARLLPKRPRDSHKGKNGHALLLSGSGAYTGAALLSAAAALRVGCGVLTVGAPRPVKDAFRALPEAICRCVTDGECWDTCAQETASELIHGKSAIGMGSGMGRMEGDGLIEKVLASGIPCVLDADALNHMAAHPALLEKLPNNALLTPHPGEMARLLGCTVPEVTNDPVETARKSAARFGCAVLLKGTVTCIAVDGAVYLSRFGNAGLAKGGSGDVLTGILTGLLAQGLTVRDAAIAGAYLLGASADEAFQLLGTRMLMAGDVIDAISSTVYQR